jgi:hypothetical protein
LRGQGGAKFAEFRPTKKRKNFAGAKIRAAASIFGDRAADYNLPA